MSFVPRQAAHCDQCSHEWLVVGASTPTHCAKCKSRRWNSGERMQGVDCPDCEDGTPHTHGMSRSTVDQGKQRNDSPLDVGSNPTSAIKPDMQELRDICAGNLGITDRAAFDAGWDKEASKAEVPICGKTWWEDGENYECLMDKGHKALKCGQRGMVRNITP